MGNKYVLTIIDAFSKCAEIEAIPEKIAKTVVDTVITQMEAKNFLIKFQQMSTRNFVTRVHTLLQHIPNAIVRQRLNS